MVGCLHCCGLVATQLTQKRFLNIFKTCGKNIENVFVKRFNNNKNDGLANVETTFLYMFNIAVFITFTDYFKFMFLHDIYQISKECHKIRFDVFVFTIF